MTEKTRADMTSAESLADFIIALVAIAPVAMLRGVVRGVLAVLIAWGLVAIYARFL